MTQTRQGRIATLFIVYPLLFFLVGGVFLCSCNNSKPPVAAAIQQRDSLPVMTTYGVSKLISDSGYIRYRIIAEEWKIYDKTTPPRHTFMKGIFMEKLDVSFQVDLTMTADTAYWYDQKLWELRGNVYLRKQDGTTFSTDELFWNMDEHKIYSNKYMCILTPSKKLDGYGFYSNEDLSEYMFYNSSGYFPKPEEVIASDSTQTSATESE